MLSKLMLPQDKANHLAYGLLIYSFIALFSSFYALAIVIIVASLKEIIDSLGYGTPDKWDWVATAGAPIILETIRKFI